MQKYVVIYDITVGNKGEKVYITNQTYYADSIDDIVV